MASWATTIFAPSRCQKRPTAPRSPSANPARKLRKESRVIGVAASINAVATPIAAMKSVVCGLRPTSLRNGILNAISLGTRLLKTLAMMLAKTVPQKVPMKASKNPSVTNCRTSRANVAPSAPRTAISRLRLSERTKTRLPTFTQAMISRRKVPPRSMRSIGRMSPVIISFSGTTLALRLRPTIPFCC